MRPLFPSRSLAVHRRQNTANLPHTCEIEKPVRTKDGKGGWNTTWMPEPTKYPCRVSPVRSGERVEAEKITGFASYQVVFDRGVAPGVGTRFRIFVGTESILLDPHGSNGPRSFEAQRKYECSVWGGP